MPSIQSHGCVVVFHAETCAVSQIGENAPQFFGLGPAEAVGRSVSMLFTQSHGIAVISDLVARPTPNNPLYVTSRSGVPLEASAHRAGNVVLLEVERANADPDIRSARLLQAISSLQNARTRDDLVHRAATEVRELTGFDRVVVHRCTSAADGDEVVAEARRDGLRPFAHARTRPRRFESSNRPLHVRDIHDAGVRLVPNAALDTSHAHLRSAPAAHVEYLREIGSRASMSVVLSSGDEMIGLLACHHHAGPKPLHWTVRESVECLGKVLASGLAAFERAADVDRLRALNRKLVEGDRAKDVFIATMAHELRTPLNAISGWSRIILDGAVPEKRRHEGMRVVARNADVLAKLVDDLLDVSRIASGNIPLDVEGVDVTAIVETVTLAMTPSAEAKNIRLERVKTGAAPSIVVGDAGRLRQVMTNLVSNAIKFTPKDGAVTITIERDASDLDIAVRDTGVGLAAEDLARVFDAYWQGDGSARRSRGGLGLGLAIAKKLVELHGGRIFAESEGPGSGSTFHVRLPIANADAPQAVERVAPSGEERDLRGIRAVVVEDEPDSRELVRYILEARGATVRAFGTAADALAALRAEAFDVIVSDVGLPEMDGMELLATVRTEGGASAQTPAVALTAYTRESDREAVLRSGFQAHVAKPADAQQLVAVIASVTGRTPVAAAGDHRSSDET